MAPRHILMVERRSATSRAPGLDWRGLPHIDPQQTVFPSLWEVRSQL